MNIKSDKKCLPCARSAALNVGDAFCHKVRGAMQCHELAHKVEHGDITIDRYLDILAGYARTPNERAHIQKIKAIMYDG